jgi:phage terminase small subunit
MYNREKHQRGNPKVLFYFELKGGVVFMALTKKQKAFVQEYLIDLNATQAAIRAGYSPTSARQIADENMSKPDIKNAIDRAIAERSKRTGINADRIILELAKIAFVNPTDVINMDEATVRGEANREDTAAISSVKVKRIPTEAGDIVEREVKVYDKIKALELLGKHVGMFTDKFKVEGAIPIVIKDDMGEDDE